MELLQCVATIVGIIAGLIFGIDIGKKIERKSIVHSTLGRLRIDHSDPYEDTRMFVELKGVTPDMIAKHEYVTFEVVNESYLSCN